MVELRLKTIEGVYSTPMMADRACKRLHAHHRRTSTLVFPLSQPATLLNYNPGPLATGQTPTTPWFCLKATRWSYRLTVGSQWPGCSSSFVPNGGSCEGPACQTACGHSSLPCSSPAGTTSTKRAVPYGGEVGGGDGGMAVVETVHRACRHMQAHGAAFIDVAVVGLSTNHRLGTIPSNQKQLCERACECYTGFIPHPERTSVLVGNPFTGHGGQPTSAAACRCQQTSSHVCSLNELWCTAVKTDCF